MSKTIILCHVVFGTKFRDPTILPSRTHELYKYIYGLITIRKCKVIRINGIEDHVHILLDLHPSVALAELVRAVKQSSSNWIKEEGIFPKFEGWAVGYYAASVSYGDKESCRQYIISQEEHHKHIGFREEMESAIKSVGLVWYEDDWK